MEREIFDAMEQQERSHWWFVARREIIARLIGRHAQPGKGARVLEAGCGSGGNLAMLSTFGELHAFEHDPQARASATQRSKIVVVPGTLPRSIDFPDGSFELVALLDVLEHLDDDIASLSALRAKLTEHGRMMITVPAVPWLWSEHDVLHHHKRRYTKRQLVNDIRKAGLTPVIVGYFNSLLLPLAVIDRLLVNVGLKRKPSSDEPGKMTNWLFTKVFSLESAILKLSPFPIGLSLYAIAVRNCEFEDVCL